MVDWWCWWLWEVCMHLPFPSWNAFCSSELYYVCVYYSFISSRVFTSLLRVSGFVCFRLLLPPFHHRSTYNWLGSFRYVLCAWTRNRKHTQNNTFYVLHIKSMHVMAYHHHSCLPVSLLSTTITFYHTAIRNDFHSKGSTLKKHDFVYMLGLYYYVCHLLLLSLLRKLHYAVLYKNVKLLPFLLKTLSKAQKITKR